MTGRTERATPDRGIASYLVLLACVLWSAPVSLAQEFSCFPRKQCPQMRSCAEAYHHLTVCGSRERDGDNDGIPCEGICGKTLEIMHERLRAEGYDVGLGFVGRPPTAEFSCTPRKTCGQMRSCEEAKFHFEQCGARRLDGNDRDGIPCNSLCRR